jgi:peroxiredoxin
LLRTLETDPASPAAFDAATWILLNTPDGPAVDKAAGVLQDEHLQNTNLVTFCQELERVRHRCATNLLEALLINNANHEVRGAACFTLATLRKEEAEFGRNQPATLAAETLFERVLADYGQVRFQGRSLAALAEPELMELRRLILGKRAPELTGTDLEGRPMKLSEYRGKVVLLLFWSASTFSDVTEHAKLLAGLQDQPLAFVGVNCDDSLPRAAALVEQQGIDWRSFWDGRGGPIAREYNVNSWPTTYLLDRRGVIRGRELRGGALREQIEALLRE